MVNSPFISKSKYLSDLQCHKLLWYYYNAKDQIPEADASTQAIFDQGHLVGEYAKKLFHNGVEVGKSEMDIEKILALSSEAIRLRRPLFEAAFKSNDAYARVDILNPVATNQWDIIEVKSSTEVKEINIHDLALQRYVYAGAGIKIRRCYLLHINNSYVRNGEIDINQLFVQEDVTDQVDALSAIVQSNLEQMQKVIRKKTYPEIKIGQQCNDPYSCPLIETCWNFLPENNPTTLYYFKKEKAFELINQGIIDILDLPDNVPLSDKQSIQIQSHRTQEPFINQIGITEFLLSLKYPLYFLDFETFGTAIPFFDNVKPYQQIPFQYSIHIVKSANKKPKHYSFLADGNSDPRPQLLQQLKKLLGTNGSIVCYNASFEKNKLKSACEVFPEYKDWYDGIEQRIVDLFVPFRSLHYYHPNQHGSTSMKAVLPALTGMSYEGMEIADGGTASNEYLRVTFGDVSSDERTKVREQLEEYCGLDTLGMVRIDEGLGCVIT